MSEENTLPVITTVDAATQGQEVKVSHPDVEAMEKFRHEMYGDLFPYLTDEGKSVMQEMMSEEMSIAERSVTSSNEGQGRGEAMCSTLKQLEILYVGREIEARRRAMERAREMEKKKTAMIPFPPIDQKYYPLSFDDRGDKYAPLCNDGARYEDGEKFNDGARYRDRDSYTMKQYPSPYNRAGRVSEAAAGKMVSTIDAVVEKLKSSISDFPPTTPTITPTPPPIKLEDILPSEGKKRKRRGEKRRQH
jgi:hypothetical protein